MNKRTFPSIAITLLLLTVSYSAFAAVAPNGEVFLKGNYVEIGIHNAGSFGTASSAPAGFHPYGSPALGFVVDPGKDGWTVGSPAQSGDYFLPGTPEEGWMLEWSVGSGERQRRNFGRMFLHEVVKTSLTETSSGDTLSAVWEGVATIGSERIRVVKTIRFNTTAQFFVINTVLTNTGTVTLDSVEYLRNVDPDQEQPLTGNFVTDNWVVPPPSDLPNQRLVVARGLNYGLTLGLGTIDSRAVVSTEGFSNRDPDAILDSPVQPSPSSPIRADQAIALAFRFGSLAPGQSVSFDHAYILNASDLRIALGNLAAATILQPTGTISGNSVLFQATTNDVANTLQVDFFVNGASVGSDTTPDAGGVFQTSFNSLLYPNGSVSLRIVARFRDGTVVEKTSSATVDNSGPPVSFSTPANGDTFSGSGIPVAINILDPSHPPVRVSFFRETSSSGSLFLGEDATAPFGASFSVTGLPEGETVIIKAVAYDNVGRSTTIQVSGTSRVRTTPTITWSTPAPIAYGTALGAAQLNAAASAPGTFTYSPAAGTVLPAGSHLLTASFTPADPTLYTGATATVTLTVLKATPLLSWSDPAPIVYGTALGGAQLNATSSVPGSFSYSPAAGAVLNAGTQPLSATFTPTDSANYQSGTVSATLVVQQATPVLTWSDPADIVYGTALGGAQLNATSSVPGTFTYTPAAGTVLNAGTHGLSVSFTPSDSTNYRSASKSVTLKVQKATPVLTWTNPSDIVYGTPLSATQLNATSSVPGSLTYTPAAGAILTAGSQTLSVSFTPSDTANYTDATTSVALTVQKATPAVTWSTPSDIVYGTPLSAAQLNATASVPGSFAYTPAAGTDLNAGSHTLSVNFTPDDTANYNNGSASVVLRVLKATPSLAWPLPVAIDEGTALTSAQLNAVASFKGSPLPGTYAYTPGSGSVLDGRSDPHMLTVVFTPADIANFNGATANVPLTVNNVKPVVVSVAATPVPVALGSSVTVQAVFTDAGVLDTHTATIAWDDGTTSGASIEQGAGSGKATGTRTFAATGVYRVVVTVRDDDGGDVSAAYEYVVVYDPLAGFVTGGGWIESPAGALALKPELTGKANFGFVSKYEKGANTPKGNTAFHFNTADFKFESTSYEWLVISGDKAQYRGVGKVNGGGEFGFILTAHDGQRPSGDGKDRFRIKIWDRNRGNAVVYDNRMNQSDDVDGADPQVIAGGSIVIHTK